MIFSPLPGKPIITQGFGQNPDTYKAFDFDGHEGIDFGVDIGTMVYAPHDGVVTVKDDKDNDYGLHVVIKSDNRYSLLAHLSEAIAKDGQTISQGDPIGKSGKSGFCTAAHLHWTYKILKNGVVQNKDNGYNGAVDATEFTRLWLDQDLHNDAEYTEDAKGYLAMTFTDKQYLKNSMRDKA
jgi:murein DD-endopeptidase MepM/ murein hydrolase activator NlpD